MPDAFSAFHSSLLFCRTLLVISLLSQIFCFKPCLKAFGSKLLVQSFRFKAFGSKPSADAGPIKASVH
jgi:hypothetical protein